ncbi:MAG: ABC transporter permease, partial [Micromonosporaceae bacterium]|nr:ABC transporter permease [Micromonosporaceae bacterium]
FNYISYATGNDNFRSGGQSRAQLLVNLLPQSIPHVLVQGLPMFGGALVLVLGALVAGNGFGWGAWKTAFTQGPSRVSVIGGSLVALSVFVVATLAVTLTLFTGVSVLIAVTESQAIVWPALGSLATAFGGGLLVLGMWALFGYALGVLARGPALSVGLGLVWVLVVENLLRGVAGLLSIVEQVTRVLPGTAGGSLVGAIVGKTANTAPGVLDAISGQRALVTVAAYIVGFTVLVLAIVGRRDLA